MIGRIRHNLGYKLMSLAVAFALWFYVNSERNPHETKTFTVPITVIHVADGYIADINVRDATVTVKGPKSAVDAIGKADVEALVDMAGPAPTNSSSKVMDIQPSVKEAEGGLEIDVNPKTVRVSLEELGDVRLPVEVRFPAVPPLGYAYSNPEITPASVSISGKVSEVAKVKRVALTLPNRIPSGPINDSFPVTPVDAKGAPVSGVVLDTSKVRLRLELVEVPASKTVIVSPTIIGVPAFPATVSKVSVTPSLVTLQGRPAALADVTTLGTTDISIEGTSSTTTHDVSLIVPDGVTVVGRNRVRVVVHVSTPQP